MGKLKDAVLQCQREWAELRSKPQPDLAKDPVGAYEYTRKGLALQFRMDAVQRALPGELSKLRPELRAAFLQKILSADQIKRLAAEMFDQRMRAEAGKAANIEQYWGGDAIFGRPMQECLATVISHVNQEYFREHPPINGGQAAYAYINAGLYLNNQAAMSPEQRKELYVQLVTDERLARDLADDTVFAGMIEKGLSQKLFGVEDAVVDQKTWEEGLELLEQNMSEAERSELAERLSKVQTWEKREDRTVSPVTDLLNSMESGLGELPEAEAAAKKQLLQQAREILVFPSRAYQEYLDKPVGGNNLFPGFDELNKETQHIHTAGALRELPNEALVQKLPREEPHGPQLAPNYQPAAVYPPGQGRNGGIRLDAQELQSLQGMYDMPVPPEVKKAILSIYNNIDKIGSERYARKGVKSMKYDQNGNVVGFRLATEQPIKYYAFYPLANAKEDLLEAVLNQDWAKMQQAITEYTSLKPLCDQMMRDASSSNQVPFFPGNVNSTRPRQGDALSPMPTEYLEDVTGHSRVNAIYRLYAVHHNTGIPVEKLLDHPGAALQELSEQTVRERIDPAFQDAPLGVCLARCLSPESLYDAQSSWASDVSSLSDALSVVDGFVTDDQERQKLSGRNYGALAAANYAYRQQLLPWEATAEGKEEQRLAFARMALLTPPDQLELRKLGEALCRDNWEKRVNPGHRIEQMRKNGTLDPGALTARTKKALADMRAEQTKPVDPRMQSQRDADSRKTLQLLQKAALQNYRQALRLTPDQTRSSQGWKELQAHTTELQDQVLRASAGKWQEYRDSLDEKIQILSREKTGPFLSKTNSPAYDRMMKALRRFRAKLDLVNGIELQPGAPGEPGALDAQELEQLRSADAGELFQNAKQACFSYCSEKTNAGRKDFVHEAGLQRFNSAFQAIEYMGNIADEAAIRNPAMALKDEMTRELLLRRSSKSWLKANGERCVASTLYALNLHFKGVSPEKQAELLEDEKLEAAVQQIRNDPAFRNMLRKEGLSKLTDLAIGGPAKLSDAYIDARQRLNNQPAARPNQRSAQQDMEFWKDAQLGP